jgi:tape measure domain-containing protein
MSITLEEMKIVVRAEVDAALAKLGALDKSLERTEKSANQLADKMSSVGKKMSLALTLPLVAAGGAAVKFAMDAEKVKVSLGVMLGSADKATKVFSEWRKFADKTPFEFEEISKAGKQLIAFGSSSEKVTGELRMLGDIAAGVDMSIGELAEIYGKARTQQTLYAEDINQLAGRGIPVFKMLAKEMGVNESQVKKLASEGKISFETLQSGMQKLTSSGGQFSGMMDQLSQTGAGKLSTALDALKTSAGKLGETMLPIVKDVLDGVTKFADGFAKMDKGTQGFILTMGGLAAAAGPVLMSISSISKGVAALRGGLDLIKANPVWLAISVGAGIAVGAMGFLDSIFVTAAESAAMLNDEMDKLNSQYESAQSALSGLNSEEKLSEEKINELTKMYPKLAGKVDLYKASVGQVLAVLKLLNLEEAKRAATGYISSIASAKNEQNAAMSSGRSEQAAAWATIQAANQFITRLPEAQKKAIQGAIKEAISDNKLTKDVNESAITPAEFKGIAELFQKYDSGNFALTDAGQSILRNVYNIEQWSATVENLNTVIKTIISDLKAALPNNMVYNDKLGTITYTSPASKKTDSDAPAGSTTGTGSGAGAGGVVESELSALEKLIMEYAAQLEFIKARAGISGEDIKKTYEDLAAASESYRDALLKLKIDQAVAYEQTNLYNAAQAESARNIEAATRELKRLDLMAWFESGEFIGGLEESIGEAMVEAATNPGPIGWASPAEAPQGPSSEEVARDLEAELKRAVEGFTNALGVAASFINGDFLGGIKGALPLIGEAIGGIGGEVGGAIAGVISFIEGMVERAQAEADAYTETLEGWDDFNEYMSEFVDEERERHQELMAALDSQVKVAQDQLDELRSQKQTELQVLQDQWQRGLISTEQYTEAVSQINNDIKAGETAVEDTQAAADSKNQEFEDAQSLKQAKEDAKGALDAAIEKAKAKFERLYEDFDTYNPALNLWGISSWNWNADEKLYNEIKNAESIYGQIESATSLADLDAIQIPRFAKGGVMETSGPQLFMAGDNPGGRERITVEPLSSGGYSSGVTIQINAPVYGVDDLYLKLAQAGRELVRQGRA